MAFLDCKAAWQTIERYQEKRLIELFEADSERVRRLSRDVAGIHFDWSKTPLDSELVEAFAVLAYAAVDQRLMSQSGAKARPKTIVWQLIVTSGCAA